jgi:hypothetical protein
MAGVVARGGGTWAYLEAMEFGPCTGPHMFAEFGAEIANYNPHSAWKITGNASYFITAQGSSQFGSNAFAGPDVTIPGPVSFSGAFVNAAYTSTTSLVFGALTGAANVTGMRYSAYGNSLIASQGGGPTYYPGTIAGTLTAGGQYA